MLFARRRLLDERAHRHHLVPDLTDGPMLTAEAPVATGGVHGDPRLDRQPVLQPNVPVTPPLHEAARAARKPRHARARARGPHPRIQPIAIDQPASPTRVADRVALAQFTGTP